jgi:2-succinyl-6-hydroxy-2,4-cyclohexadiene-1-carboxylate synthase
MVADDGANMQAQDVVLISHDSYHVETIAPNQIVMLHGFMGSTKSWYAIVKSLTFYQSILLDIAGHGKTTMPEYPDDCEMEVVSGELNEVFTQLKLAPFHLLGYSMGGRLALYTALNQPFVFKSLILESGSPGLKTEDERAARRASDEKLAQMIERDGIEAFVNYWELLPLWDSQKNLAPEVRQQLRDQRLKNNPIGLANSLRGMGTGAQPSLWDKLPELNIPVLLIAGELDTKFVAIAQEMHSLLPNSRLVIVPNAGHTVHLEQPELYTQAITAFLASL